MSSRKRCGRCTHVKGLRAFPIDKRAQDGRRSICRDCRNATRKAQRRQDPRREMFRHAKRRAKAQGVVFDIEVGDINIPNFCPVLGLRLSPGDGNAHDGSPTIDRKVPSLGYTKTNICVISSLANRVKNNATPEQIRLLLEWVERV